MGAEEVNLRAHSMQSNVPLLLGELLRSALRQDLFEWAGRGGRLLFVRDPAFVAEP